MATVVAAAVLAAGLSPSGAAVADTSPAAGTPSTVSADPLPTWQINGVVWSQVLVNNVVYATGSFTKARPPGVAPGGAGEVDALNIFAYDVRTGERVTSFNHSLNAQGRVVAASPDGSRVYVGGDFTAVDGVAMGHVAAFNASTGALDTAFRASVSSQVRALAATGSTLYVGGSYQAVNGVARKNLSAVSATTGSLLAWAPTADNGPVWAMVLAPDQSRVIAGGSFTTLNGQSAYGMGSLSTSTGATLPWAANTTIRNGTSSGAITSLRTDGRQIYGSGYAYGTGSNFEGTFAADPTTGSITVVNDCHGDTYDVVPVGPVLYSVGHAHNCTWVRSFPDTSPRVRWQRALAQTIAPTTTNIGPDSYGWNYNGLPASTVLHWFPQMPVGSYTGQYQAGWSVAGNGDYVVMGGEFPSVNGVAQQGLVRMAVSATAPNRQRPTYDTKPSRPVPATTAVASGPGQVRVDFGTAWDYDNESLTYDVLRDSTTWVHTSAHKTNFWTVPTASFTDTGLAGGSSHYYQVRIRDSFGNTLWSPKSNTVTVESGGTVNQPPVARFTTSCSSLTCGFTSTSTDGDGSVTAYAWKFGDGGSSTAASPSRTYAAAGTYTVTLTVTDDDGAASAPASQSVTVTAPPPGGVQLSVRAYKVKGLQKADLKWSGAGTTNVDIHRNGARLTSTLNDGSHTDAINAKGSGTYTYKVCESGTAVCSSSVTVVF